MKRKSLCFLFNVLLCFSMIFFTQTTQVKADEESNDIVLVDKDSSVRVKMKSSAYKKGYHLNVTVIDHDLLQKYPKLSESFDESQKKFAENYKFFNIEVLTEANEKVESYDLGTVTVYIPVDAGFQEKDLKALQIFYGQNNDVSLPGEIITLDAKKYYAFQCKDLEDFAIVDVDTAKTLPILIWSIAGTFLITAAIISIVLLVRKHRKKLAQQAKE